MEKICVAQEIQNPSDNRDVNTKSELSETLNAGTLLWKDVMLYNKGKNYCIAGQYPICDSQTRASLTLDSAFITCFPKQIEGLYATRADFGLVSLLSQEMLRRLNNFLEGKSDLSSNLEKGDCMDFVYALTEKGWVEKISENELGLPKKEQFVPYGLKNDSPFKPVLYYSEGEWKHVALSLGHGLCLSRMGEGGDLLVCSIESLSPVYGDEVLILKA